MVILFRGEQIFQNVFNLTLHSLLIELPKTWFYVIVFNIYIRKSMEFWNQKMTVCHQYLEHNY